MKQRHKFNVMIGLIVLVLFCVSPIPGIASADEIAIDVSPNVLNLESNSVVVTVHTDIPYFTVIGSSVSLNGVGIDWWKYDDRGYFVAKFLSSEVKALEGLAIGEYNTLVLEGTDIYGDSFFGTQDILVIQVEAQGKTE